MIVSSFYILSFAKDIPLKDVVTIYIPNKTYSVIEFPFKITDKKGSSFYSVVIKNKKKISLKEEISIPKLLKPGTKPSKKNKKNKSGANAPVIFDFGPNSMQIFPKKLGHMDIVLWGHRYPIIVRIVVDDKLGEQHYTFIDYDSIKKEATEYESEPHEKILGKLTIALYNNKTPKGYKNVDYYSKFTEGNLEYILIQSMFGSQYIAEEWRIRLLKKDEVEDTDSPIEQRLYAGMFDLNGIYSISFENDFLKMDEATRMFIIRKTIEENK
ncbi:MAG: hypothetical protein COB67_00230 [SAR324 cluster bacterium]|uniref:Uncharacterized protein n=1 Tax=SAR324 cluster bacterium TaxID=2024889 RepID=A0A2A4TBC6_9DELT|nr:MAG: hypothetical protein COB67_00230 [SAR324 cluster bacterium]